MKTLLYRMIQITWGCIQTILGLIVFLYSIHYSHYSYKGSIVTEWDYSNSVSLGMFIFLSKENKSLLNHEYGHTIQSLLLGPFYLIIVGIPSYIWCNHPYFIAYRKRKNVSYFDFYCEKWANYYGYKKNGMWS